MNIPAPENQKIYHMVHFDKVSPIMWEGSLFCDSMEERTDVGTSIGMARIKQRRRQNRLSSCPDLTVGDCVPFYFCPRTPMLYRIYKEPSQAEDGDLSYRGGQNNVVYLVADLRKAIKWANNESLRYVFTVSNAGAGSFEDYSDLYHLNRIDWEVIGRHSWWDGEDTDEGKEKAKSLRQAEFLVEERFDWSLFSHIGVASHGVKQQISTSFQIAKASGKSTHFPVVELKPEWYF